MRLAALGLCAAALAQSYQQRGYLELRTLLYPQTALNDRGHAVSEAVLRWEPSWKINGALTLNAAVDARSDTHRQFERRWRLDWRERGLQRPAFSLRRLSLTAHKNAWTFEAGRQFIRWGKADLLNPTDRFAPRDFMSVVNTDYLGVTAARLTWERGGDSLDLVYTPSLTPSRGPLLNQRWVPLPPLAIADLGTRFAGRGQQGVRWNRVGRAAEYSLSFFDGYNHLPLFEVGFAGVLNLQRHHARLRSYGGDAAVPLRWFTLKAEGAWFTTPERGADEYIQYVLQAERHRGEWHFVGGYAGEYVTKRRAPFDFAPDRGIARTFLGRASYNLDANRSLAFEGAVRQNGAGAYGRWEYSQAAGAHWRATASFTLIRGEASDFLGQFRRNSHAQLIVRYSF